MDLNTNQVKQTFNQPKKKFLTLEARHSLSIEAANKIRSKLRPRLFMPRTPLYRYCPSKFQCCSKELKTRILKTDNFKYTEFNSKCQTSEIVQDFVKRLKGKYTEQSNCDESNKTMDSNISLCEVNKRCKLKRKSKKRSRKHLKHNLDVAIQNLEKPMDIRSVVSVKDVTKRNWESYITDNESISVHDPLAINSLKPVYKAKKTSDSKNLQTKIVESFEKAAANKHVEIINKNNDNSLKLRITQEKSSTNTRKRMCDSKTYSTKLDNNSKESANQQCKDGSSIRIGHEVESGVKNHSKKDVINSSVTLACNNNNNSAQLPTLTKSFSINLPAVSLSPKEVVKDNIGNDPNLENIVEKNLVRVLKFKYPANKEMRNSCETNIKANENIEKQAVANIENRTVSDNGSNQKHINKETKNQPIITKSGEQNNKPCVTENLKNINSVKHPLHGYLHISTTGVADFQDAVRSSLSLIYDCSAMDKRINQDLMNLENTVENFSKYLLQTYNDVEEKQLKSNNCIEYLRKKEDYPSTLAQSNRPLTSSLSQSKKEPNSETLTILIQADKMPTQTITFKTVDILCPKTLRDSNKMSKISIKNARESPHTTSENSSQGNNNSTDTNTAAENVNDMQKSNKKFPRMRTKITPKKPKPLVSNTQNEISSLTYGFYDPYKHTCFTSASTTDTTSAYTNVIYSQAQRYDNSYLAPQSLGTHSIGHNPTSSINSQVAVTNSYNYSSPTTDDLNTCKILLSDSQRTTHLYPREHILNRVPSQVLHDNPHRFEYHNHYVNHQPTTDSNDYNFQPQITFDNLRTINLPAYGDSHVSYG